MHPQTAFAKPTFATHDHLRPGRPDDRAARATVRTFRQRDHWSRLLARDRRVKLMHRHVLRSLALCARLDANAELVIDPTYAKLAKAAGCSERTAYRAIVSADEAGIVRKVRRSDGRVANAYELVLQPSNPAKNAAKASEKTQTIQCPTLPNLADAESSNPATAVRVLKGESKEGSKISSNTECVATLLCSANGTSDDAPNAVPRAEARHETRQDQQSPADALQQAQQPARVCPEPTIGRPASAHAGPGFDAVRQSAREVFGARGDAVAARLLAGLGDDVEDALDTLAAAAEEADPMAYLQLEVERHRASAHH